MNLSPVGSRRHLNSYSVPDDKVTDTNPSDSSRGQVDWSNAMVRMPVRQAIENLTYVVGDAYYYFDLPSRLTLP